MGGNRNPKKEPLKAGPQAISAEAENLQMPSISQFEGFNSTKVVAYFAIAITLLFVASFAYLFFTKSLRKSQLNTASAKLSQLNAEIESNDLAGIEEESVRFGSGFSEINSFLTKRFSWYNFFIEFEKLLPKNCKITNITVGNADSITIKGEADSFDSVAKFVSSLESSGKFTEVKLNSSSKVSASGGNAEKITYEINPKITKSSFGGDQ